MKIVNILKKEDYLLKDNMNKKEIELLKKNPKDYINNLSDNNLIKLIQDLNYSYYVQGISLISDELYDYIKDELRKRIPNHPLLIQVGVSNVSKTKLPYYMGAMDKIKSDEDVLNRWIKKYPDDDGYVISDKLDGISGLYHNINNKISLYTRRGQDVSHLLSFIKGIADLHKHKSEYKEIAVRGEFIITKDNFLKIKEDNKDVKNVRNMVAGIFNSKKPNLEIAKYIDFVAYECIIPDSLEPYSQFDLLDKLGFNIVYNKKLNKLSTDILSKILEDRRKNSEYDIDGIIVTQNKVHKRITSGNPKYSFAFKNILTLKKVEVMVLEVKWNITKDNYIQPVVLFDSIELNGVMIEKATGFNGKFIKDNKIGPGSKIIIVRRGDVIPHIEEVLTPSETGEGSMPNYKYTWNKTGIEIVLDKSESRVDIIKEKNIKELENFVTKIKFDRISVGMVKKLYNADINTIYKFLNVTKEELLKVDGIKEKTADNILNSIKKSMKDIDCIKLMVASNSFGRGFAVKKLKLIMDNIDDTSFNIKPTIKELISIKGIEKKTAEKFIMNIDNFLNFLEETKIKCVFDKKEETDESKPVDKTFENINVVFTGVRDKELEKRIEDGGGSIKSSITKSVNYLIVKEKDTTSSKVDKAKELGIEIITLEEFNKKF
tara:strand:- start:8021 stop:9997 length:1977 start_codon:yes stop_codon:yes gene_type:complete